MFFLPVIFINPQFDHEVDNGAIEADEDDADDRYGEPGVVVRLCVQDSHSTLFCFPLLGWRRRGWRPHVSEDHSDKLLHAAFRRVVFNFSYFKCPASVVLHLNFHAIT